MPWGTRYNDYDPKKANAEKERKRAIAENNIRKQLANQKREQEAAWKRSRAKQEEIKRALEKKRKR